MEATTGRMLIRVCGVMASTSCVVMRSRTTRSMRDRPVRTWFWMRLADRAQATVAEVVDVVDLDPEVDRLVLLHAGHGGDAGVQAHQEADRGDDVVDGQRAGVRRHVRAEPSC
ncbi:hypothetical protein GCM10025868_32630 [Angustibacter aerolatus]|uniref:Secreted protein n=1 Tax=Angustibacter aerolatus TaxID=1162965 RepID=A0ABQ6JIH8_9ACTN|nr:hypothetical protein GCM10025868_32630 [Angustibacter aerolatus]